MADPTKSAARSGSRPTSPPPAGSFTESRAALWIALSLLLLTAWSHYPTFRELIAFWRSNEDYSVGQLVPLFAVYLVWADRRGLRAAMSRPAWSGLAVLLISEAARVGGTYYGFVWVQRMAILLALAGVVLIAGGWGLLRRLKWTALFLCLMIPPPTRLHEAIAGPLQQLAVSAAAFALELGGLYVVRAGQVLIIDDRTSIGVAEACSGLRMLTAFVFVAAVLAFLVKRPAWQRTLLVLSSIPIAVMGNMLRTIATAWFIHSDVAPSWNDAVHDVAGLLMMPVAVLLLFAELRLFDQLTRIGDPAGQRATGGERSRLPFFRRRRGGSLQRDAAERTKA